MSGPRIDLTGRRFGRWTVLQRAWRTGRKWLWAVHCRCGSTRTVRQDHLMSGESRSCGCFLREKARAPRPSRRVDLRGRRVGALTVVRLAPHVPSRSPYHRIGRTAWVCRCDCGRDVVVPTSDLVRTHSPTRSCGCAHLRPLAAPPAVPGAPSEAVAPRDAELPPLTLEQRAAGWHDSNLGRVRTVLRAVDDDDVGGALHDFDPFA